METYTFNTKGYNAYLDKTCKFNMLNICITCTLPLERKWVTALNIVPQILATSNGKYHSLRDINTALDKMGGAEFSAEAMKKGDYQVLYFSISIPKSYKYWALDFLNNIIFNPLVNENAFDCDTFKRACICLETAIDNRLNNKKAYAEERLIEIMYQDEPFGICSYGYKEDISLLTAENVYTAYKYAIEKGHFNAFAVGDIERDAFKDAINRIFPKVSDNMLNRTCDKPPENKNKLFREKADSAQCCYMAGIYTKADAEKLLVANEVLGGSATSRLFNEIREKEGMCYYVNSTLYRYKGTIVIKAGIEENMAEKVTEIIKKELKRLENTPKDEIKEAVRAIINRLITLEDYPSALMDYMLYLYLNKKPMNILREIDLIAEVDNLDGVLKDSYISTIYTLA